MKPPRREWLCLGRFSNTKKTNTGKGIKLDTGKTTSLVNNLANMSEIDLDSEFSKHLIARMENAANGQGSFSYSAKEMATAFKDLPDLKKLLEKIEVPESTGETPSAKDSIAMIGEFFKGGLCRSAQYQFNTDLNPEIPLDTHDGNSAKKTPATMTVLMDELAGIFQHLEETPFDDSRSLFDVTTVLVSSEFGRTARQGWGDISESGTDHNPLTNSFIIAGKGIKGGQVVGQSDLQDISEFEGSASPAHVELDEKLIKAMGRPFNFDSFETSTDLPESYDVNHYLNVSSVINTIYKIFNIPAEQHRRLERNGDFAPVLENILDS